MFRRKRKTSDFSAEIEAHVRLEADRLRESGIAEEEAQAAARRAFGNLAAAEERFYEAGRPPWWDHLGRDLQFAFRSLRRERAFAAFAVLLIGLGTGLTTTMFALFDAVALRKLDVPDPDSLFHIVAMNNGVEAPFRYAMFQRLRENLDVVDSMFAETGTIVPLTHGGLTRMVSMQYSIGDYYRTIGARLLRGRVLTPADDGPVAVISDAYWRRIGKDPDIVGKTVRAGPVTLTIVGVVPAASHEVIRFGKVDVMVPFRIGMLLENVPPQRVFRYNVEVTARLKPGATPAQLQQRLDALWPRLLAETTPPGQSLAEWTRATGAQTKLQPGNRGRLWAMGDLSRVTLTLLLLAGLVSLTMCSNLAGLLLSRGMSRQREYAVRMALGAGRWRLVRHALSEVLLLSLFGSAAAILLAQWLTGFCSKLLLSGNPWLDYGVRVDWTVAAFALLLSVATAVAAQIIPALRLSAMDLAGAIKLGSHTISAPLGSRKVTLAVQVAASLVLVSGSLLFVRTVQSLMRVNLGFRAQNVLAVRLTGKAPWSEAGPEFFQELLRRVRAIPSVAAAGLADRVPMELPYENLEPIAPASGGAEFKSERGCVWPGFFDALQIPMLSGRDFLDSDTSAIILTHELAQSLFPGGDPLGRFVRAGKAPKPETYQVIGVFGDVRFRTPRQEHRRMFYVPCRQVWSAPQTRYAMGLAIRRAGPAAVVEAAVRGEVEAMGKQAIVDVIPLEGMISKSTQNDAMLTTVATGFGAWTLFLTCAGVYALIDLSAAARRRELGIRMALGANRRSILQLMLKEAVQVIAFGAVAGLAITLILLRVYRTFLYGVADLEPLLIAGAMAMVAFFALVAALAPAWRAARREPGPVLRMGV
jgi:predicted permease